MRILILAPYPLGQAPSQRFRFEQYLAILEDNGHQWQFQPFLSEKTWSILYKPGHYLQKVSGIISGFLRRFKILFQLSGYDFILLHREATPIGPPIFEWLIARVFKKEIIYDFDDAIWIPNTSQENRISSFLKWNKKVSQICKWSHGISAGNAYLADFASKFNSNVTINPTTIDTDHLHNKLKNQESEKIIIGWTGSHSTLRYIDFVIPILEKLEYHLDFEFHVIANQNPNLELKSFRFVPWRKETEVEDLLKFNIGIMPLETDPWSEGKCGFKALQYLALGTPTIASPIGVNKDIVLEGENGFLCSTPSEWEEKLTLLQDTELRKRLGDKGRKSIIDHYSVQSNKENFLALFN